MAGPHPGPAIVASTAAPAWFGPTPPGGPTPPSGRTPPGGPAPLRGPGPAGPPTAVFRAPVCSAAMRMPSYSGRTRSGVRWRWAAPLATVVLTVISGCSTSSSGTPVGSRAGSPSSSSAAATAPATAPTTTTTTEQPGWTPVSTVAGAIAVDQQSFTEPDGHLVTVVRFRAPSVTYALHVGSTDPPRGQATIGPNAGPAIGPGEAPYLLAAFNGGFESKLGGGFEINGQVLVPLQAGLASLVIDADGSAHIGVWGQGLPAPGEQVVSVRQNLAPLVAGGQPSANVGDIAAWGATLGGGSVVARSSLGQDAAGDLLYAAGMASLPTDLASALVAAGAVNAMELDINPEWVQLAFASTAGGPLSTAIPGQNRPADQYQTGWTRDFVTVLARH